MEKDEKKGRGGGGGRGFDYSACRGGTITADNWLSSRTNAVDSRRN